MAQSIPANQPTKGDKDELREKLGSVLHLNGCQQRTHGYNEAKDGKDLDVEDTERLEGITLEEVMLIVDDYASQREIEAEKRVALQAAAKLANLDQKILMLEAELKKQKEVE